LGEGNKKKVLYSLLFNLFENKRKFEEENYLPPSPKPSPHLRRGLKSASS